MSMSNATAFTLIAYYWYLNRAGKAFAPANPPPLASWRLLLVPANLCRQRFRIHAHAHYLHPCRQKKSANGAFLRGFKVNKN